MRQGLPLYTSVAFADYRCRGHELTGVRYRHTGSNGDLASVPSAIPITPDKRSIQANGTLNYAYGCLEASCRQALAIHGFDVACGFLHADLKGRDSLVYDLMELERGTVDGSGPQLPAQPRPPLRRYHAG